MRTYVDQDGAFVHLGDLCENIDKILADLPKGEYKRGISVLRDALEQTKCQAIEQALSKVRSFHV